MDPFKPLVDGAEPTNIHDISEPRRDERLATEFDLVRVRAPVYLLDRAAARERSAGAERVAKHREKQAAQGLIPTAAPADLVAQVKAAGSWPAWLEAQKKAAEVTAKAAAEAAKPPPKPPTAPPLPPVLPPEIEAQMRKAGGFSAWLGVYEDAYEARRPRSQLTEKDRQSIDIGRRLANMTGWRRGLVFMLLGIK
jgi:hypothetical protein